MIEHILATVTVLVWIAVAHLFAAIIWRPAQRPLCWYLGQHQPIKVAAVLDSKGNPIDEPWSFCKRCHKEGV